MLMESHTWKTLADMNGPNWLKRCITVENDIWAYGEKEEKGGASTQIKTNRQRMVPLLGGQAS
ncbi:hypothetical protein GTNG_1903 [Geobacillus thermodenitrificans NG80-2]|uniref:Uncharacterized protein n=1 Tax=Geobacillus thermodenitrificans (strain NG80-2) TaxID=420246 RepID=A4IPK7_GEOTN|nr:hypothetical protein GTNG_1903 [Geobacillus thermodenitrificans NG80-2]